MSIRLLVSAFIIPASILYYNFPEFIILLYSFLVTLYSQIKEYSIRWISLNKFSDASPAFICAGNIENL